MRYLYKAYRSICTQKNVSFDISFGIALYDTAQTPPTLLCQYDDIFLEAEEAESFAALCTKEQLEPVHFLDVLEDILP